jgi:hypothetical protein
MLKLGWSIFYDWLTQESFGELVQRKRQEFFKRKSQPSEDTPEATPAIDELEGNWDGLDDNDWYHEDDEFDEPSSMTDNDGNEILAARFAKLLNIAHVVVFWIIVTGFVLGLLWIWGNPVQLALQDNRVAVVNTIILIISLVIAYFVFVLTIGFFATIVSINRRLIEIRDISKKRLK